MELIEKVLKVMPREEGTSKKTGDQWFSQDLVLITNERYPKEIALTYKGANVKLLDNLKEGDKVKVTFDIESHESKGRYYTSLLAWKLEVVEENTTGKPALVTPSPENQEQN